MKSLSPLCQQPHIRVGILTAPQLHFVLNGPYRQDLQAVSGTQSAQCVNGAIQWDGREYSELVFRPEADGATVTLSDVTIGLRFHWQRQEVQTFGGTLRIIPDGDRLVAINVLPVEDYLVSVISSEMRSTSSLEFLKASAVVARSWLFAQLRRKSVHSDHSDKSECSEKPYSPENSETLILHWYDREDHTLFDVCADDHCQRYQGLSRALNPQVERAVRETHGLVLSCDGEVCDARFSKCCGGRSNEFQYCWQNVRIPYLRSVRDLYCRTSDADVLRQVLNDYDQETTDFYRWSVMLTQQELQALILSRQGSDVGQVLRLEAVERGPGGHISLLRIVGSRHSLLVGKELEIRRTLSRTHLKSSAFVAEALDICDGVPQRFRLVGRGWGHGVGMCQIGAAMMGEQGHSYTEILHHYFSNVSIEQYYC